MARRSCGDSANPAGRVSRMTYPSTFSNHVQRHADQLAGVLEQDGRHRDGGGGQRALHPGFPGHVVRPRQQRAVRRSAQHGLARIACELEGQVRLAAGDERGLQPLPPGVAERPRERRADEVEPGQVLVHRVLPCDALWPTLAGTVMKGALRRPFG